MPTNTSSLKTFAQQTRAKLISLITTKMQFVLNADTAELRGYERQIGELRKQIAEKSGNNVIALENIDREAIASTVLPTRGNHQGT